MHTASGMLLSYTRKNVIETKEIIPVMEDEVLQFFGYMKKCKCPGKDKIAIDLIKKSEKEFAKCKPYCFFYV